MIATAVVVVTVMVVAIATEVGIVMVVVIAMVVAIEVAVIATAGVATQRAEKVAVIATAGVVTAIVMEEEAVMAEVAAIAMVGVTAMAEVVIEEEVVMAEVVIEEVTAMAEVIVTAEVVTAIVMVPEAVIVRKEGEEVRMNLLSIASRLLVEDLSLTKRSHPLPSLERLFLPETTSLPLLRMSLLLARKRRSATIHLAELPPEKRS